MQLPVQSLVRTCCRLTPGVVHLDLGNRPITDQDLEWLLQGLSRLQVLTLSGCKKLVAPVPALMCSRTCEQQAQAKEHPCQPALLPTLLALDLQRCFQLDSVTLSQLLHAVLALSPRVHALSCLAMSHLDLRRWPLGSLPCQHPHMIAAGNGPAGMIDTASAASLPSQQPDLGPLFDPSPSSLPHALTSPHHSAFPLAAPDVSSAVGAVGSARTEEDSIQQQSRPVPPSGTDWIAAALQVPHANLHTCLMPNYASNLQASVLILTHLPKM